MIPSPSLLPPQVAGQNNNSDSEEIFTQQMQDLKLTNKPFQQNPQLFSPQHGPSTTVTYSSQPGSTYPYTNNNLPSSGQNNFYSPSQVNGIQNGHQDNEAKQDLIHQTYQDLNNSPRSFQHSISPQAQAGLQAPMPMGATPSPNRFPPQHTGALSSGLAASPHNRMGAPPAPGFLANTIGSPSPMNVMSKPGQFGAPSSQTNMPSTPVSARDQGSIGEPPLPGQITSPLGMPRYPPGPMSSGQQASMMNMPPPGPTNLSSSSIGAAPSSLGRPQAPTGSFSGQIGHAMPMNRPSRPGSGPGLMSAPPAPMGLPPSPMGAPPGLMSAAPGLMGAPSVPMGLPPGPMGAPPVLMSAPPGPMGAPPGSMGAPPGPMGAPPGAMGAPSGPMGAPPGLMGAPSGPLGAPPGPMSGPPGPMSAPPGPMSGPPGPMSAPPGPMSGPPGSMGSSYGGGPNSPSWQGGQPPSSYASYGAQQQQQQMLNLDLMPSVVNVRQEDRNSRTGYFATGVRGEVPPLVTTDFIVQDKGMCNPSFIRSSVYCLPNSPDVLKQTGIPFAITVSPLAKVREGENDPPRAMYRDQGPLRCKRCKAYICSFMTFMEGGRCFQCAFCKVLTEVPQDYFCFLDGMGERTDKYHRPELCLGSYEYIATKEYCRKDELPNPPAYIFMIEVSSSTFRNGMVQLLCENMKFVLQSLKNDENIDPKKLRVGFVTYNNMLHFYNMKKNLTQPHIMVLSDVHNAFMPLLEGFLVTLEESEGLVDSLMEHIPKVFANEPATETILGPVVQVGLEALKNANCSGKLLIFHSTIPNADAPGKLSHRDGQKLLGTEKQKIVLGPQSDFYSKLAQECVAAGCAVDIFLFPNAYVDIATISPLCRHTGGEIYKYTYFQSHVDGDRFLEDLERNLSNPIVFDAVLRVRTSAGISPVFYYGNFYMSNTTDIELSAIDCHKAVMVEFAYDEKLPENETVFIQAALLYTSLKGERMIRVHNLALPTSVNMPDIFKACELDGIVNFFAKHALKQLLDQNPHQIKSAIIDRTVKILGCYRKNYATDSATGQLVLPDSLKLLPIYANCLLKNDAINGGSDMTLDDRSFAMLLVNSMDIKSTITYLYPNIYALHDINPDSNDIPHPLRCSIEKLNDRGAYLLDNGIYLFLWIGQAINPSWLEGVFGVQTTNMVDKQKTSLPELDTSLSKAVHRMVDFVQDNSHHCMRLTIVLQGDKLDIVFRHFLVEDRGTDGSTSYVDFLCHLHREINRNS